MIRISYRFVKKEMKRTKLTAAQIMARIVHMPEECEKIVYVKEGNHYNVDLNYIYGCIHG